jgi:GH24 family phage-related lysozyme (muramidase)
MLANGYGYLNEAPTFGGTTKYWPKKYFKPDGTPDFHDHFHIGKDYGSKYAASFRGVSQQQQPRAIYTGNGWRNIAADNIMRHEGFMQHSYADAPKGKSWRSIGYGFNDSGFYNKYPMGISKYYDARGGITRAEAQQELNYMLDNMERQARAAYGSRWDQFNDNQKAAIMDTMYQRPASVLKGSQFHRAVMAGDPNAVNYLGVNGFDKRNADRRGLFGSPSQYAMQMPMQQPMQQMDQFAGWEPSNPQAFYGQGNSAIDREMAEKMANMEATMKAYQEAQEQQQLAAARQAERQEKAARANLAWNFVMGMNGDNQQQSPYMGLLGALSSNAIMGEG